MITYYEALKILLRELADTRGLMWPRLRDETYWLLDNGGATEADLMRMANEWVAAGAWPVELSDTSDDQVEAED